MSQEKSPIEQSKQSAFAVRQPKSERAVPQT
jgi:hypothetical protein